MVRCDSENSGTRWQAHVQGLSNVRLRPSCCRRVMKRCRHRQKYFGYGRQQMPALSALPHLSGVTKSWVPYSRVSRGKTAVHPKYQDRVEYIEASHMSEERSLPVCGICKWHALG